MTPNIELTVEEGRELESLLQSMRDGSTKASLGQLLRDWSDFVRAVENGYDDSIYEYTNDLSVRDSVEQLIANASSSLAHKLKVAVSPLDEQFANATESAKRPLSPVASELPPWWWTRVPRRRTGELADDLSAMGHIG